MSKKKLIEVALPLVAISDACSKEKALKNSHPANLHLWWARRPLAAARAVLWASLIDDPSSRPDLFTTEADQRAERDRLVTILEELIQWSATAEGDVISRATAEIDRCYGIDRPVVLDPFGGGGAIPLEALRLGLRTVSGDINPVAVLIQRAMLQVIPRFAGVEAVSEVARDLAPPRGAHAVAADFVAYASRLRDLAEEQVGAWYPSVDDTAGAPRTPIAWIWARTVRSPDPSWPTPVPLVKSWVLAKRPGNPVTHVVPVVDRESGTIRYDIRQGGTPAAPTVARGEGTCLATGVAIPGDFIKAEGIAGKMGRTLIAIAAEGDRGRVYVTPNDADLAAANPPPPRWQPTGAMSDHPQYMGTPRYGLDEWSKLFTPRQLLTLTTLVDLITTVRSEVERDAVAADLATDGVRFHAGGAGAAAYADAIALFLMFAIDKLADINNNLAQWEPVAQCPRHLFGRQAVQMTWDYAEANPFSTSSGSFATIVDGIARAIAGPAFSALGDGEGSVSQIDARANAAATPNHVLVTDPPYYDNVPYSDLADFFYVWQRHGLRTIFPDDTATLLTPKAEELVADQQRLGSKQAAQTFFEHGITEVFAASAANMREDTPAAIFYAFKATEQTEDGTTSTGWSTFLAGVIEAGLTITATWPIRTENKSRLRAMKSNALASSVVLVCRRRPADAELATRGDFIARLRAELPNALALLQQQSVAPVDLAQAAIGPGISIFSRYARVVEADGRAMTVPAALALINDAVAEVLSGEESEFDAPSRFAVTWYEQYGTGGGPFGDADLLARAKDTSVAGVVEAGIATSRDGEVRLLAVNELDDGWDPVSDARLTVWEVTHYLVRALDRSESEAAALMTTVGAGLADRAKQLAYLLYNIANANKRNDHAGAYNMLVTAWPELVRLAGGSSNGSAAQERMI